MRLLLMIHKIDGTPMRCVVKLRDDASQQNAGCPSRPFVRGSTLGTYELQRN
jgi:hypothetical protein